MTDNHSLPEGIDTTVPNSAGGAPLSANRLQKS